MFLTCKAKPAPVNSVRLEATGHIQKGSVLTFSINHLKKCRMQNQKNTFNCQVKKDAANKSKAGVKHYLGYEQ